MVEASGTSPAKKPTPAWNSWLMLFAAVCVAWLHAETVASHIPNSGTRDILIGIIMAMIPAVAAAAPFVGWKNKGSLHAWARAIFFATLIWNFFIVPNFMRK